MTQIIDAAKAFAKYAHRHQRRKYTGEPYFNHCAEVANIVYPFATNEMVAAAYFNHCAEVANIVYPFATNEMVAAAYLHDTIEDCEVDAETIEAIFGEEVCALVKDLSDVSKPTDGNRRTRKDIDLAHTAKASPDAKTIKLADLISNTKSIVQYDPDFARVYLREKERLLEVLQDGHNLLFAEANYWLLQSILELKEKGLWK